LYGTLSFIQSDAEYPSNLGTWALQAQIAQFFHYPIPSARIGLSEYTSISGVARYKPLLNFKWHVLGGTEDEMLQIWLPLLRQADVLVRYANGETPYPTSITDARIWGSAGTGFSFAPGDAHDNEVLNLWPEINQPFAAGEAIRVGFVIGAGMDSADGVSYGPEYRKLRETVRMLNYTAVFHDELLCEWSFDKLG